jgi:diadenosine tetraphosphate (Ap4A) HIT family hydrolase
MQPNKKPVFETKHWLVVLAEEQTYLGYGIVVLKRRPCGDLADVTEDELLDFLKLVKRFEAALRSAFDATMFNWSCLMNNAYQEADPKPHVHWHVKPRYNHKVEFGGEVFEDPNFGHHYVLLEDLDREVSDEMQDKIVVKIQEHLPL